LTDSYSQFLCACLRRDGAQARALTQTSGWDWERLLKTATEQAVLPALAALVHDGLNISLPKEISDLLSEVLAFNRERNDHIWNELKAAAQLLNDVRIEPVLLKGAAYIAAGVYPDSGARYLLDLDLLIPEAQLPQAVNHLVAQGYSVDETDKFGRFRHHHPQLSRGSVSIELHHKLGLGRCQFMLPARQVIESAVPLDLDGIRVRLPSPTHLAMHLIMHSQMLHPYNERIWPPLRAMYDLIKLRQRFGNYIRWADIEDRFRRADQYGLLALYLLYVRDALGSIPPFKARVTFLTRVRGFRRMLLRRLPLLRYFDPIYMLSILFTRRLRVLRSVLSTPRGPRYLVSALLAPGVYKGLFLDVVEGRGH
jgi:Uncharacterised nucleotidyltransferase